MFFQSLFFFFSLSKSPIKITQHNSSSSPKCKRPCLCIFSLESSSTLSLRLLIPDKLMFWVPALSTKSCGSTSTPWAKLPLSAFQNHPYLIVLMSRCLWSGCSAGLCMSTIFKYFMTVPWLLVKGMSFYSPVKLVLLLCFQPLGMTYTATQFSWLTCKYISLSYLSGWWGN